MMRSRGPTESSSESLQNGEHEERLVQRGSGCVATFALLGSAGNARLSRSAPSFNGKPTGPRAKADQLVSQS